MKHYIDENGKLFGFEDDGSQDYLIPNGAKPISFEEAKSIGDKRAEKFIKEQELIIKKEMEKYS